MTNTPEMRRPPQLWEQRLTKVTSIVATGMTASGATSLAPPDVPPATGGNFEPSAVTPPPGAFIKPSTPTLVGGLQGINVLWDGLNADGDLWPYDTSFVEVHMATSGTAFTPGTATLKGRLARPGNLFVGGLTAGTTYHFRLRGVDAEGNVTDPSDAASGLTGLTTAGDYGTATIGSGAVSFNARSIGGVTNTVGSTAPTNPLLNDVWLDSSPGTAIIHKIWNGSTWVTNAWGSASIAAGQITALQIAAGAITAGAIAAGAVTTDKLTAGTISGFYISGGTIAGGYISGGTMNAGYISGGTISGARFVTSAGGARVRLSDNVTGPWGTSDAIEFFDGGSQAAMVHFVQGLGLDVYSNNVSFLNKAGDSNPGGVQANVYGDLTVSDALRVDNSVSFCDSGVEVAFRVNTSGEVFSYGIDDNTTASAANVRVGTSAKLLKSTSTQNVKTALIALDGDLAGVNPDKLSNEAASVNPYDVLDVIPTEFQSLCDNDASARMLGFIAENVATVFPWAAEWDDAGQPNSVADRPILAALLQVVKDQQATITDLRSRIEALEA